MMRIVDALLAIPALFLLLFLADVFQPSVLLLIVVVGLTAWLVPARLVRGEALTLRTREYVQAARTMGVAHAHADRAGTSSPTASARSWSTPPSRSPTRSWSWPRCRSSASASRRPRPTGARCCPTASTTPTPGYWWLTYPPGIAIVLTVVAFNLIGDGLRDAFGLDTRRR